MRISIQRLERRPGLRSKKISALQIISPISSIFIRTYCMRQKISFLTLSCLLLVLCEGYGANYYFSTKNGDDNRTPAQAQNSATPWKTLNRLNSFASSLLPGDSVLFHRGEAFYGPLM